MVGPKQTQANSFHQVPNEAVELLDMGCYGCQFLHGTKRIEWLCGRKICGGQTYLTCNLLEPGAAPLYVFPVHPLFPHHPLLAAVRNGMPAHTHLSFKAVAFVLSVDKSSEHGGGWGGCVETNT